MASSSPPHVVEDFSPFLQLLSDGSVIRFEDYNKLPPPSAPPSPSSGRTSCTTPTAASSSACTSQRPRPGSSRCSSISTAVGTSSAASRWPTSTRTASASPASSRPSSSPPTTRLSPEHRLPAAVDDAATVISWVRGQAPAAGDADPWLAESADFSRVFVSGNSAGGNIVHHVTVRLGSGQLGVDPARVAGYVLLCPLFGGEQRTASEAEFPPGPFLTLPGCDRGWRLVLPPGSTRDHPFGPDSPALDGVALPPVLVVAAEHDLLRDRAADYVARLKAMGKPVELVEFEGQHHCFFVVEPSGDAGSELVRTVKRFVYGNGGGTAVPK